MQRRLDVMFDAFANRVRSGSNVAAGVGSHGCGPVVVTMPPLSASPTIELPPIAPNACSMG